MKTKDLVLCAIFAAIISIFSVITIPIGQVPVTMSVFGILLTSYILGPRRATIATAIYILLGAVGLPVFSGFRGGLPVLFGATGGYIISYIPVAIVAGIVFSKRKTFFGAVAGGGVSVIICYLLGTIQLMIVTNMPFVEALGVGVIPFIIFDAIKIVVASIVGIGVSKRLPQK